MRLLVAEQTQSKGFCDGGWGVLHFELLENVDHVRADGAGAHVERGGDFFLDQTIGQQTQFLVVCRNTTMSDAYRLAEEFRIAIEEDANLEATCSFGVNEATAEIDFATHLDQADRALYEAKRTGRNKAVPYNGWSTIVGSPESGIPAQSAPTS